MSINLENAKKLIIQRSSQLVNKLITVRGHNNPPFLSEEFANLLGIKKIERVALGETSGILLRLNEGTIIKVNQNQNQARQNFSCAHEIGHILFNELKLEKYINTIEHRTFNPSAQQKARTVAVEKLCDAAAAELLMPENIFKQYLVNFGVTIASVEKLSKTFQVSLGAAVKRISEVSTEPCIAMVWRPQKHSNNLRLTQVSGPKKNIRYLPKNIVVKKPSLLHQTFEQHIPVKSIYTFYIGNEEKHLPMESKGFGFEEFKCVVSLAMINR